MLLNHQQRKILELLCKTEHVTASELAGQLGIGVKTVRVRIKELNPELEKNGMQILYSLLIIHQRNVHSMQWMIRKTQDLP